jgi:type VI protein secretion system component VasK
MFTLVSITVFLSFCFVVYFLPLEIAVVAGHPHTGGICVLNLFLGWTVLFWVVALVWACTSVQKPAIYVSNKNQNFMD